MSVKDIILADCLTNVAPPEDTLRISAIGDTVWLYIEKYDEDPKGMKTKMVAEIAVSLPALREALQLMRHDIEREDSRQGAKLTGSRASVLPL